MVSLLVESRALIDWGINTSDFNKEEVKESLHGKPGWKQSKSRDPEDENTQFYPFQHYPFGYSKIHKRCMVSNATSSPWNTIIWGGKGVYSITSIS